MTDFPFADISRKAAILSSQGHDVFQKFTCSNSNCLKRVVSKTPNIFLDNVTCPHCGKQTNIGRIGCNYEIK